MTRVLETTRLTLRPIALADYRMRFDICNDATVTHVIGADPYANEDAARSLVTAYQQMDAINFSHHWTLTLNTHDNPIGFCDVYLPSPHLRSLGVCEVAFGLLEPYRRYGFMREGLVACLTEIIDRGGLFRIEASVNPVNEASIRLLVSLGFCREGVQRKKWVWGGERHDMLGFALLANDFKRRHG